MARRTTPKAETVDRNSPALALSGGGFRATLFHCGALMRLNELGLLTRVTRISSVSGGSIANGALAVAWSDLTNRDGVIGNLKSKVIAPLRAFCHRPLDTMAVGLGALVSGKSIGDVLADAYDDLYKGTTLQDLPDNPQFVFNAANLQTGRLVRMQKVRLADYTIGEIVKPKIRVAVAVAASTAFPPVLSPVEINLDPRSWQKRKGAIHHGKAAFSRKLSLTDGGVYDNLGLETVDDFNPVIVSDAGAPFATDETASTLWPKQALRALDIATDQSRGLRKRLLFTECAASGRVAVYAGIDGNPKDYPAAQVLKVDMKRAGKLARIRTRLNPFSEKEQGRLINWGWLMMDVAARSFVVKDAPPPETYPVPDFPLG